MDRGPGGERAGQVLSLGIAIGAGIGGALAARRDGDD